MKAEQAEEEGRLLSALVQSGTLLVRKQRGLFGSLFVIWWPHAVVSVHQNSYYK